MAKAYYAETINVEPEKMYTVSVMPCTAKKFEISREEMENRGVRNVDAVLTTRELGQMIKQAGIDFRGLDDEQFDDPLGQSTGAADIFGVTGGVMEAAIRTVYAIITGRELPFEGLHVTPIVGLDQIKAASLKFENVLPDFAMFEGFEAKVAVTSGLAGAKILMDQIIAGTSPYHFIEVMGCPSGCICGGGQPRSDDPDVRLKRLKAIYSEDESRTLRQSHLNSSITAIYKDYLGKPGGHLSHELLHTHYVDRSGENAN
jgi:NADH-quinone oxidoreductase subunit G/NADP-reducing hydrogenase subunit HndD